MAKIARKTKRYPSDLTDEEWQRILPLLPEPPKRGRKVGVDLREIRVEPKVERDALGSVHLAAGRAAQLKPETTETLCRRLDRIPPPRAVWV